MTTKADDVAIEQPSIRNTVGADADSRRIWTWAQMDIMAGTEVSTTRRLVAWVALWVTLMVAILLLLGY